MSSEEQERLAKFLAEHNGLQDYPRVKKALDEQPSTLLLFEKLPWLMLVEEAAGEALESFAANKPITARCPKCNALIEVKYLNEGRGLWVVCQSGHTLTKKRLPW